MYFVYFFFNFQSLPTQTEMKIVNVCTKSILFPIEKSHALKTWPKKKHVWFHSKQECSTLVFLWAARLLAIRHVGALAVLSWSTHVFTHVVYAFIRVRHAFICFVACFCTYRGYIPNSRWGHVQHVPKTRPYACVEDTPNTCREHTWHAVWHLIDQLIIMNPIIIKSNYTQFI